MLYCSGTTSCYSSVAKHSPSLCSDLANSLEHSLSTSAETFRSFQSPDFLFVASMSESSIYIWSLKPVSLIAYVKRPPSSINEFGVNEFFVWHFESRTFAVATSEGKVFVYSLKKSSIAFSANNFDHTECQQRSLGPNLVNCLEFELIACSSFQADIGNGKIRSICFLKNQLLIVDSVRSGYIGRVSLETLEKPLLTSAILIFPPCSIQQLEYYDFVDMTIWKNEKSGLFLRPNASLTLAGWNGQEILPQLECTLFAINLKYRQLTVWSEKAQTVQSYKIGENFELLWSVQKEDMEICSMKWSGNFSCLLICYSVGIVEMVSYLGDVIFSSSFPNSPWEVFFSIRDCDLFFYCHNSQIFSIPMTKLVNLFDNCSYTRRNACFLDENSIYISSSHSYLLPLQATQEKISISAAYLFKNTPIRIVSFSSNGKSALIAGNRAFCIYYRLQRKFGICEKNDFLVISSPCWLDDYVFVPIYDIDGKTKIKLFHSMQLSNSLLECSLDNRIIIMTICNDNLFVIDIEGNLLIYKIYQFPSKSSFLGIDFSLTLKAQLSLERNASITDTILINNFLVTKQKSQEDSGFTLYDLWILESGVLKLITIKHSPTDLISLLESSFVIDRHVYYFQIESDALVVFKGKSVALYFFPLKLDDSTEPDITINMNNFIISFDLFNGCCCCTEQKSSSNTLLTETYNLSSPISYHVNQKIESLVCRFLKFYILGKNIQKAHSFCKLIDSISNCLEILLYQSFNAFLNDPLSLKSKSDLTTIYSFIQSMNFSQLIVNVARKSDSKYWKLLFETLQIDPMDIFNDSLQSFDFTTAISSMLILPEFCDQSSSAACYLKLVQCLLLNFSTNPQRIYENLSDLIRFVHSSSLPVATEIDDLVWKQSIKIIRNGLLRQWSIIKPLLGLSSIDALKNDLVDLQKDKLLIGMYLDYKIYVCKNGENELVESGEQVNEDELEVAELISELARQKLNYSNNNNVNDAAIHTDKQSTSEAQQKVDSTSQINSELRNWIDYGRIEEMVEELIQIKLEFSSISLLQEAIDEFLFLK